MFRIEFEQLTLSIGDHRFTYAIDGAADILDFDDAWKPSVYRIHLRPDGDTALRMIGTSCALWPTLAAAVMETCHNDIVAKFYNTIPPDTYADEHRLRQHEVL